MWGESAGKIWGAFAGIFGSNRLNNRCEAGAKSQKVMAMVADSGAEKPCLMGDVPPVFLLNCVCGFICVKHYVLRIEQASLEQIKRFIYFHRKRHARERCASEVEAYLTRLDRKRD